MKKWKEEMGGRLHMLSDEDYARANEMVKPVEAEWIEQVSRNGLPGADMLKLFRELEQQHHPLWKNSEMAKYVD